jgi:hypothetical protein
MIVRHKPTIDDRPDFSVGQPKRGENPVTRSTESALLTRTAGKHMSLATVIELASQTHGRVVARSRDADAIRALALELAPRLWRQWHGRGTQFDGLNQLLFPCPALHLPVPEADQDGEDGER